MKIALISRKGFVVLAVSQIFLANIALAGNSVSIATQEDMAVFEKQMVVDSAAKAPKLGTNGRSVVKPTREVPFGVAVSAEARKLRDSGSGQKTGMGASVSAQVRQNSKSDDGSDNRISNDTGTVRSNAQNAAGSRGKSGQHGRPTR